MKNLAKVLFLCVIICSGLFISSVVRAEETEAEKAKKACQNQAAAAGEKCGQSYSCESLFAGDAEARKCNHARCESKRGKNASYCTCKYGKDGNGQDVGIPLNTSIPFIGRCLHKSSGEDGDQSALNAFPTIVSVASRMLVTVIMLVSVVMIIIGGIQRAQGDAKSGKAKITKVAIGFALLGMMGAILRLVNPNFFK